MSVRASVPPGTDSILKSPLFLADGGWYILRSGTNDLRAEQWGVSGDVPVPASYNQ